MGIVPTLYNFEEECSDREIEELIQELNENDSVDGIMVQLPITKHLSASDLYALIEDTKNVEGLTFESEKKSLYQNCL